MKVFHLIIRDDDGLEHRVRIEDEAKARLALANATANGFEASLVEAYSHKESVSA